MASENNLELSQNSRHSNSPFGNRLIEPHGIQKYLATLERRNADRYNEILSNRIAKLMKEEENNKKQMLITEKKTLAMMNNRERHQKELQYKEMIRKLKQEKEEEQRVKNFMEREKRKQNLYDISHDILRQKQNAVSEIRRTSAVGDHALHQFKDLISKKRAEKVQIVKFQTEARKNNRSRSQFNYKSILRQEYERKIEEEKELYTQSLVKRKKLEAMESDLLQKVSISQGAFNYFSPQSLSQHEFATSYSFSTEKP
jgi:hypothetical protein